MSVQTRTILLNEMSKCNLKEDGAEQITINENKSELPKKRTILSKGNFLGEQIPSPTLML